MRRYVFLLAAVVLLSGVVGVWMQAHAEDYSVPNAPAELTDAEARPLPSEGSMAVDPAVRTVAGTGAPPTSSTRRAAGSGLAGRLQTLRREEAEAPLQVQEQPGTTAAAPLELDPDQPAATVGALPSVLKRGSSRQRNNAVGIETPDAALQPSPSDVAPTPAPMTTTTTTKAAPVRTAPSRARAEGTTGVNKAAPRVASQTLSSGASASLAVETTGPKTMNIGKPSVYVVNIVNQGVSDAAEVYVAVNLPKHVKLSNASCSSGEAISSAEDGGQRLVWKIVRLAGRGNERLSLELVPEANEPVDLGVEWTMAPPVTTARLEVLEPKLSLAVKGPSDIPFGDTAVYQVIVSNPGTGDAEDVTVELLSAENAAHESKSLGTLAAGAQKVMEVSMTATQAGQMAMKFAAKSGNLSAEAGQDVMVRRAKLELAITGPQLVFAGATATYQVKVTNTGDAPADGVQLGTNLPTGCDYLGGIQQPKSTKGQLVWTGGRLIPGASGNYEFTLQMNNAGSFDVQIQTKSGDISTAATTTTKVEAVADLKLTVNDPQGPRPVGEEVTYEVTLVNRGTKAARKVAVAINFSEGIEPVSVAGGTAELGPGQVIFTPLASIEAGGTHKLLVKAKADKAGSHIFRAEVRCADPETRLASEQTTRFFGGSASPSSNEPITQKPATTVPPTATKPSGYKPR